MEERMIQFVAALRAGGVRISLAETADAFNAVDRLGVQEREDFRLSLRATLVKDASGLPVFDELFPLFFDSTDAPPMSDVMEEMTQEEAQMLADMMRQFSEQLRQLMEKLLRGEQLNQQELDQLGQQASAAVETVTDTVESVTEGVQQTVESVSEGVQQSVASVQDALDISGHVQRHPWLAVGAAVAAGYVVGSLLSRPGGQGEEMTAAMSHASVSPPTTHRSGGGRGGPTRSGGGGPRRAPRGPPPPRPSRAAGSSRGTRR